MRTALVTVPVAEGKMRSAVKRMRRGFRPWACWVVGTTVQGLVTYSAEIRRGAGVWELAITVPWVDETKQAALRHALKMYLYALATKPKARVQLEIPFNQADEDEN